MKKTLTNFEKWLEKNHQGVLLHKMQDSTSFRGAKNSVKVPADFVGIIDGRPLMIECKETISDKIYVSQFKKDHQVEALEQWCNSGGIAGYIIMLWKINSVFWIPISKLNSLVIVNKDTLLTRQMFPYIRLQELIHVV